MSAATRHHLVGIVLIVALWVTPTPATAQEDAAKFVLGAALAFASHESGHLALDVAFDASPGLRKVSFGPLPFFAITHDFVPPGREFAISSAGFWVQHAVSEWILIKRPGLHDEHAPMVKGMLAFNVLASIAYSGAAFGRVGPAERDTRGMADAARIDEPWIGVMVLTPAVFDAARYYRPDVRWLRWASRVSKVTGALLVLRAAQ